MCSAVYCGTAIFYPLKESDCVKHPNVKYDTFFWVLQNKGCVRNFQRCKILLWGHSVPLRNPLPRHRIPGSRVSPERYTQVPARRVPVFFNIGNCVPYIKKTSGEAHSREDVVCRKRLRSARECAKAHSLFKSIFSTKSHRHFTLFFILHYFPLRFFA